MLLHADFSRRAIAPSHAHQWVPSPQAGVERVMLDRVGAEQARATSLVRYAPHSHFPRHGHPGGEEILVLSGTFFDEHGHYPAGWYLRNPPGSGHQPGSDEGTVIFVKLWQMPSHETHSVRIDTRESAAWQHRDGRAVCALFSSEYERVELHKLAPQEVLFAASHDGAELLVLAGDLVLGDQSYERGSWLRLPAGDCPLITAGTQGATVYLKTGHLPAVTTEASP